MIEGAINLALFLAMGILLLWGVVKVAIEVYRGDV